MKNFSAGWIWQRYGCLLLAVVVSGATGTAFAQPVVPGTGTKVNDSGDDFESEDWKFIDNFPKGSHETDGRQRMPAGFSKNGRWQESAKRGQPDVIRRIPTPEGGLPGSKGSMLLRSFYTGSPQRPSFRQHQDDLILKFNPSIGGNIPVSLSPSVVVRVYMLPFETWEDSTSTTFGFRAGVTGMGPIEVKKGARRGARRGFGRFLSRGPRIRRGMDDFYPGMFIQFNSETDQQNEKDSAFFMIRGNDFGQDFVGPEIKQTGWWTLGLSLTPDGRAHYYMSPGIDDLTQEDHVASHFPQSVRCVRFNTVMFNIVSQDDGKNWSTPWIVDDVSIYYINENPRAQQAQQPNRLRRTR